MSYQALPFHFEIPVEFFEKADAPAGQQRRVGGIISTDLPDRQGEVVLQNGLDFKPFIRDGWLNDNHSKKTAKGLLGYPADVQPFSKGEVLPNGSSAKTNGHWMEGYLLDNWGPADEIWKLGKALQKTNRRLGYSVEGAIHRRIGPKTVFKKSEKGPGKWVGNTVASATVRNVAITNCPVSEGTGLEVLAKSLRAVEESDPTDLESRVAMIEKALTMGPPSEKDPEGPKTGEGAGAVHAKESLEGGKRKNEADEADDDDDDDDDGGQGQGGDDEDNGGDDEKDDEKDDDKGEEKPKKKNPFAKSLTHNEAASWVRRNRPEMTSDQISKFLRLTGALVRIKKGVTGVRNGS